MSNIQSINIEKETLENTDYRRVIYTEHDVFQTVLMSIPSGQDIPMETHSNGVQFIRIEGGYGIATVGGQSYALADGVAITIPPGVSHRIQAVGTGDLKLYSIYTPPEHDPYTIHKTRAEAQSAHENQSESSLSAHSSESEQ